MLNRLSDRQKQCLAGVAAHRTSKEIAADLGISPKTVDGYIADAVALLGARNRQHAATTFMALSEVVSSPVVLPGEPIRVEPDETPVSALVTQSDDVRGTSRGLERLRPFHRLGVIIGVALALSMGLGLSAMAVVGGIAIYDPSRSSADRSGR